MGQPLTAEDFEELDNSMMDDVGSSENIQTFEWISTSVVMIGFIFWWFV